MRWLSLTAALVICFGQGASSEVANGSHDAAPAESSANPKSVVPRAYPSNRLAVQPKLVGIYGPDGRFRKMSGPLRIGAQLALPQGLKPAEVPPSMDLPSIETVLEDYAAPLYVSKTARARSAMATVMEHLVSLAYGRERVLIGPTHVITDSRQRLIITDPELPAVHVLDISGKNSFRIAAGPRHRLQMPAGVAVDSEDNIYVADGKKGMLLVYNPQGRFLRYIGNIHGEGMFELPSGIALDRYSRRLYVLDSAMDQLVVLDLDGKLLKRVGSKASASSRSLFDYPSEVAIGGSEIAILDRRGSRVQIFDLQGNLLKSFSTRNVSGEGFVNEMGLSLDGASNIYISNVGGSRVWIYDRDGKLLCELQRGIQGTEFNDPSGIWIDSANRIYVADTRNGRVQVFRTPGAQTPFEAQEAERHKPSR